MSKPDAIIADLDDACLTEIYPDDVDDRPDIDLMDGVCECIIPNHFVFLAPDDLRCRYCEKPPREVLPWR